MCARVCVCAYTCVKKKERKRLIYKSTYFSCNMVKRSSLYSEWILKGTLGQDYLKINSKCRNNVNEWE